MAADMGALTDMLTTLAISGRSAVNMEKANSDYILNIDAQNSDITSEPLIAATTTTHTVRLYNKQSMAYSSTITGHTDYLTGVEFSCTDKHILHTSSLDGTVRTWDLRTSPSKEVQKYSASQSLSSFSVDPAGSQICAGTSSESKDAAELVFWDTRSNEVLKTYQDSHNDDVTHICYHPHERLHMLSGSTDGLVCMFDTSIDDEDDSLITAYNSDSSVNRVGWCGKDKNLVYCTTHIETFHCWSRLDPFKDYVSITDIKDKLSDSDVQYIVDCFHPAEAKKPCIVAGSHSGDLHIVKVSKDGTLEIAGSLTKGHSDTVRCMLWDEASSSLITGGEDSMLTSWRSGAQSETESRAKDKAGGKMSSSKSRKLKSGRSKYR